jgi:transposase
MTTLKGRRKHDRNFKIEAVRLVTEGGRRVAEVARDLGIHENLIYKWRQEFTEDKDYAFPGTGNLKPADEELRRLKRQLEDVTEERDILKKALAIFSKRPR